MEQILSNVNIHSERSEKFSGRKMTKFNGMPGSFGKPQDDYFNHSEQTTRHPESCVSLSALCSGSIPVETYDNRDTSPTGKINIDRSRNEFGMTKRCAFTLAEVLITLAIIGVVAALTIPMFMENMSERANIERQVNIVQKITQATDKMRALDTLGRFNSTEAFVDELQKHLKIAKRCDNNHIAECWPTDKVTAKNGKIFEISKAKTSENLNMSWEPKTNTVGLVLADGANIILAYNPTYQGVNQSEAIIPSPKNGFIYTFKNGKSKTFNGYTTNTTGGIAFITDVNGKGKPNSEKLNTSNTENDIRSFNGAQLAKGCPGLKDADGKCFYQIEASTKFIDCEGSSYKYCSSGYRCDRWARANKVCEEADLELPTKEILATYAGGNNPYNISSGWFWTSSEHLVDKHFAYQVDLSNGNTVRISKSTDAETLEILCVGD